MNLREIEQLVKALVPPIAEAIKSKVVPLQEQVKRLEAQVGALELQQKEMEASRHDRNN